jgi:hypothetical protein
MRPRLTAAALEHHRKEYVEDYVYSDTESEIELRVTRLKAVKRKKAVKSDSEDDYDIFAEPEACCAPTTSQIFIAKTKSAARVTRSSKKSRTD